MTTPEQTTTMPETCRTCGAATVRRDGTCHPCRVKARLVRALDVDTVGPDPYRYLTPIGRLWLVRASADEYGWQRTYGVSCECHTDEQFTVYALWTWTDGRVSAHLGTQGHVTYPSRTAALAALVDAWYESGRHHHLRGGRW